MGGYRFGKLDNAWDVLLLALPQDWRRLAQDTRALKGLRSDRSPDNLLRSIVLCLGCGHSLRRTAHLDCISADLPRLTDVALLKRARKSKGWLHALCVRLFEELRLAVLPAGASQVWTVDAATVKERRRRGQWYVHYSVSLPSLACDLFKLPKTEGPDTGKSLARCPIRAEDIVLAGRGYSTAWGIRQVADAGGRLIVIVPVDTRSLRLCTAAGDPFDLLAEVTSVTRAGAVRSWATNVVVPGEDGGPADGIAGRVCVRRKSREAIRLAQEQICGNPAHEGNQAQPSTPRFADYEMVFTTFPDLVFSARDVLDWYRVRQRVELVFEHFWMLAPLGAVPKTDDSVKAWFYTKLLMALLAEKLMRAVSPSDNVSACRIQQRRFVFELIANAIEPPFVQVRRSRPLTSEALRRRVRARSRTAASRPLPDGTPEPPYRRSYRIRLERLEDLMDRCALRQGAPASS